MQSTLLHVDAGKFLWRMGTHYVCANTKAEARAKLKAILRALELLTFRPQAVTRLSAGAKITRCKERVIV